MELATLTNGHPLCAVGWAVCERHGLRHSLGLSSDKLMRLLQRVEEGYNSCAYHNATHAACVTHGVYSLLTTRPELAELFGSPLDLFTLTLAAWVHDLGHTGQNNAYHVATGSGLALQYSDQSCLEMHHLASAFQLLKQPECATIPRIVHRIHCSADTTHTRTSTLSAAAHPLQRRHSNEHPLSAAPLLACALHLMHSSELTVCAAGVSGRCAVLSCLDAEQKREARGRIISMVLATDMAVNFPTVNQFKQMVEQKTAEMSSAAAAAAAAAAEPRSPRSPTKVKHGGETSAEDGDGGAAGAAGAAAAAGAGVKKLKLRELMEARAAVLDKGGTEGSTEGGSAIQVTPSEELLILKMVLKLADIGNVTKGHAYCLGWADRVVEEFFTQGDLERQLGLAVSPMMDRATVNMPNMQLGFFDFVVKPMFEAADGLIDMRQPLENLAAMHRHWAAVKEKGAEADKV